MMQSKLLGMIIGASLLFGLAPAAEATVLAAPTRTIDTSAYAGNVTEVVLGSERRQERREVRRMQRHERRALRQVHRHERWGLHRFHRAERRFVRRHPSVD